MLDGNVNCDSVIEHLKNAGASKSQIIYAKTSDMGYACQTLANSVKEHSITHIDQQLLTDSAIDCVKRPIGRLGA